MGQEDVLQIFRTAMYTAFKIAAPLLLVSILIGLVIAIFQAATQIHEQTLTFVPKVIVIGLMLVLLGPWMITNFKEFFGHIFELITGI